MPDHRPRRPARTRWWRLREQLPRRTRREECQASFAQQCLASFRPSTTRCAVRWIGQLLLDGDRAVHAQLVVAGLRTQELVRAGFVIGNCRGASAILGDYDRLGEALLN